MRNLLLSGVALLVSALPALAQSSGGSRTGGSGLGLSSGGLGGGGLGGSSGAGGSFIGGSLGGGGLGSSGGGLGGGGGSFLGATSGSTGNTSSRGSGSGTQAVGTTTFLGPYYGNPLSMGIANSSGTLPTSPTFGTALITVAGTGGTGGSSSTYGGLAGSGGTGGASITSSTTTSGSSVGIRRAPAYSTTLGFAYKPSAPTQAQADLRQAISNSSRLTSRGTIRVDVEGPTVVLRGMVADDHERRLAEAMARLTPGVRELRNELGVREAAASNNP
jgi:hypothetical protein